MPGTADITRDGALGGLIGGATTVDLILLLVLLLYALDGVRRGFIAGVLGLIGIVVTVAAALTWFQPAADLIRSRTTLPPLVTNLAGFFAVLLVAQIVFAILTRVILTLLRPVRRLLGPLNLIEHLLGAVPGLIQGGIIAALVLTPLHLFPVSPTVAAAVDGSAVAKAITDRSSQVAPQLEGLLGHIVEDGTLYQSRILQEDEDFRIPPQHALSLDPEAEEAMLALVNRERVNAGLRPLVADDTLRATSRAHSREMFDLGYFAHQSPVQGSPQDRVRASGVPFAYSGENLAYAPTVEVAHTGLMNSPGHRANILEPRFTRVGIGVVSAGVAGEMFTQTFVG